MRTRARVLALGVGAALALGLLAVPGMSAADDDKALAQTLDKLADATKDPKALHKEAAEVAKKLDMLDDLMNLMKKRILKGGQPTQGVGVGPKPTGQADDGIEARIQNLGKKAPTKEVLAKDADALEQMARRVAAIGAVTLAKAPAKKVGNKDPKDWKEQSEEMTKLALDLAKAVKSKEPKAVKDAASKLNATCTNCHGTFRD